MAWFVRKTAQRLRKSFAIPPSVGANIGDRAASDSLVYSLRRYGVNIHPDPSAQYLASGNQYTSRHSPMKLIDDYDVVLWVITRNYDNDIASRINCVAGRSALIQSDFTKFITIYLDSRRVAECILS